MFPIVVFSSQELAFLSKKKMNGQLDRLAIDMYWPGPEEDYS